MSMLRIAFLCVTSGTLCLPAYSVDVTRVSRLTIHPSEPTEIELIGSNIRNKENQAASVWTSFAANIRVAESTNQDRSRVRYIVTPKQRLSGVGILWAYSNDSISRPVLLLADETVVSQPSDQPVSGPAALEFELPALSERRIPVELKRDSHFVAEILAARLGSEMDAVMTLRDENLRELVYCDDHPALGPDPLITFQPPKDGIYYLDIRDVEYRGNQPFQLRLNRNSVSIITTPPAVPRNHSQSVTRQTVDQITSESKRSQNAIVRGGDFEGMQFVGASMAPMWTTRFPVIRGAAPGLVTLPTMWCGTVSPSAPVARVDIPIVEGESISFRCETIRLGSPFTPQLQLWVGERNVATHHGAGRNNLEFHYTPDRSGIARFEISSTTPVAREHQFAIAIDNAPAPIRVSLVEDKERRGPRSTRFVINQDEVCHCKFKIERRGYGGPIRFSAVTVDGVDAKINSPLIEENKNEGTIGIQVPATPGLHLVRVFAHCDPDRPDLSIPVDISDHIRNELNSLSFIPASLSQCIAVVVRSPKNTEKNSQVTAP